MKEEVGGSRESFSADLALLNRIALYSLPTVANAHADGARAVHGTSAFDGQIFKRPGGGVSASDALWCRLRDRLQQSMATTADNLHDSAEAVLRIVEGFKDTDQYNADAFDDKMHGITQHTYGLPTPYADPPNPGDPVEEG